MGIKHNYAATGTNDGTKQVSVNRWNEDHVIDAELDLFTLAADPAAPADGFISLFGRKVGGRTMVAQMGPSGLATTLQPHLGGNKVATFIPAGNSSSAIAVVGIATPTIAGTATARNVVTTSLATRMTRIGYVSAGTSGQSTSFREAVAKYTTGSGDGIGGFHYRCRFVPSDAANVSGARMFIGMMANTAALANSDPATFVNCVGVAQLSASSNLQIVYGGAAAQTPIDLGANFPANTASLHAYELALFADPAGNINYQVSRLGTEFVASGQLAAANCPASSTLLGPQIWRCNNATAAAVGIDVCGLYIETDN